MSKQMIITREQNSIQVSGNMTNGLSYQMAYDAVAQSTLADSTKSQYLKVIDNAKADNVDLTNPSQLRTYSESLSNSRKAHLKAVVGRMAKHAELQAKAIATPDNVAHVTAVTYRMEALTHAVKVQRAKGERASQWLNRKQAQRMVRLPDCETLASRRDRIFLLLGLRCGLRISEALSVTFGDIIQTGDGYTLNVLGKGNKYRAIPLDKAMRAVLRQWQIDSMATKSSVICPRVSRGDNVVNPTTPMSKRAGTSIIERYAGMMDMDALRFHDLRKTCAQLWLDNGLSLREIQERLGHSSLETTQRYLNANNTTDNEAYNTFTI